MRKKKRAFKPNTVIFNLKKDLALNQDINIEFWIDPSRPIMLDLIRILGYSNSGRMSELSQEEIQEMDDRYFECASLILVDCDIEGIDFSTPESTREAFEDDRLPWGIFHQAILLYTGHLMDEYSALKNVLRRVRNPSNSGENENNQEQE